MSPHVDAILQQIELLSGEERHLLQQRLNELADMEWQAEAKQARAIALQLGIDQPTIDNAISDLRYHS